MKEHQSVDKATASPVADSAAPEGRAETRSGLLEAILPRYEFALATADTSAIGFKPVLVSGSAMLDQNLQIRQAQIADSERRDGVPNAALRRELNRDLSLYQARLDALIALLESHSGSAWTSRTPHPSKPNGRGRHSRWRWVKRLNNSARWNRMSTA